MYLLTGTSDIIRVITGSAAAIDAHVSFGDNNAGTITPDRTNTASIVTAATTTILSSPAGSHQRAVKNITLTNTHASASTTVIVEHYDGTTAETIWGGNGATLLAGECVICDEMGVWTLYGVDGVPKPASAKLDVKLYVVNDVVNATTSFADITGLTQAVSGGKKYGFEAYLFHINNATTTGSQFGVNIGAAPTVLQVATIDTVTASVTASAHSAGATASLDTAITAQTTGSAAITMAIIAGFIQPSADGTFAMRCKSEVAVAAGITVKAGSWLRLFEMT